MKNTQKPAHVVYLWVGYLDSPLPKIIKIHFSLVILLGYKIMYLNFVKSNVFPKFSTTVSMQKVIRRSKQDSDK